MCGVPCAVCVCHVQCAVRHVQGIEGLRSSALGETHGDKGGGAVARPTGGDLTLVLSPWKYNKCIKRIS